MWWTQQQRFTLIKHESAPAKRIVTESAQRNVRRSSEAKRAPFRQLSLTAEQRLANRVLSESHSDTRSENEILLADIRALELALQTAKQFQFQQAAEVSRLRSECDRWLSETYLLSEQLANLNRKLAKTSAETTPDNREEMTIENGVPTPSVADRVDLKITEIESDESVEASNRRAA